MSKQHLIITSHEGLAEYVKRYIITYERIERENLEVEVKARIDTDRVEEELSGKHVYCLTQALWMHYAIQPVIVVEVDMGNLGVPLSKATAGQILTSIPMEIELEVTKTVRTDRSLKEIRKFMKHNVNPSELDSRPPRPKIREREASVN